MALPLKVVCLTTVLLAVSVSDGLPASPAVHLPWLPHQYSTGPIVVPGVSFPSGFPFPVKYPLPAGFPFTPLAYENLLPSLVDHFNSALAATANNVAAASAAVLAAFAPNYNYNY